jgi:7-cyano-7-deazaguanine synthase
MRIRKKAIILLSGGIDSSVCLWWAKAKGFTSNIVTFNYFDRNPRELEATKELYKISGSEELKIIEVNFLREMIDMPKSNKRFSREDVPAAYIPGRNTVFYAISIWWGEILNADYIIGGHNKIDFNHYLDSRPEYIEAMNEVIRIGTYVGKSKKLEIITPLSNLSKAEIVKQAIDLNVPLELTWSCHGKGKKACGICEACLIRKKVFSNLEIKDLIEYE